MRILISLTYYSPYISGLTFYAVRLAEALVKRGHSVTVLTSRFDSSTPLREVINGVQVVRVPVAARLSKAVLMPGLFWQAQKLIRQADVVNLFFPQMDGALLAILSRILMKKVVITYICDLNLPPGLINRVAGMVSAVANQVAAFAASLITAMSQDYADRSVFLQRNHRKVVPVDAPVELPPVTETDLDTLRARWNILPQQRIIGMVARLAAEKGVEYLAQALPLIRKKFPQARVIYVGQYQNVLGEESYFRMLAPMIEHLGESWTFAGNISYPELAAFYRLCDVTVLPSLNSTEAFGMVQVESIISGTPVVSTDLPGVRLPVVISGMGKLVPPREAPLLANAVMDIFEHRVDYLINPAEIQRRFSPKTVAAQYEIFFRKVTSCS